MTLNEYGKYLETLAEKETLSSIAEKVASEERFTEVCPHCDAYVIIRGIAHTQMDHDDWCQMLRSGSWTQLVDLTNE